MIILKGTPVTLSPIEMRLAHCIGIERNNSCLEHGVKDKLQDEGGRGLEKSIQGAMGEVAFCKLVNSFPDCDISPKGQLTDTGDLSILGLRFDIKTTHHKNGHLTCKLWKNDTPDAYALMIGNTDNPTMTFAGFAWSEELKRKETIQDFKNLGKPQYALSQKNLHNLDTSLFTQI